MVKLVVEVVSKRFVALGSLRGGEFWRCSVILKESQPLLPKEIVREGMACQFLFLRHSQLFLLRRLAVLAQGAPP